MRCPRLRGGETGRRASAASGRRSESRAAINPCATPWTVRYAGCEASAEWRDGSILRAVEASAAAQYTGEGGKAYWAWQQTGVDVGGKITALLFADYASPNKVTVDVGCGSGTVIANLEASEKWCVELNPLAREYALKVPNGPSHAFATVDELPDDRFDLVTSNHALEHTPCPLVLLRKLLPKLKKGGMAVFMVPSLQDEMIYQKSLRLHDTAWGADDNNHHLYVWSSQQLANLFRVAGYEVVEAQTKKYSRTANSDGAWRSGGAEAFWVAAERENRHPQTKVVARRPAA